MTVEGLKDTHGNEDTLMVKQQVRKLLDLWLMFLEDME